MAVIITGPSNNCFRSLTKGLALFPGSQLVLQKNNIMSKFAYSMLDNCHKYVPSCDVEKEKTLGEKERANK